MAASAIKIQEAQGSSSTQTMSATDIGHHTYSFPQSSRKAGSIISFQGKKIKPHVSKYLSLFQGCCWLWPPARKRLTKVERSWRSPGLKTACPWGDGAGGSKLSGEPGPLWRSGLVS